ncbi:homoserine O-acetyltransferase [Paraglaciecola sp. MB-3u-78]|uniref:E22 family MetX-like putative esterase n=1 Tax=Paraglaciecola sp. MB-3u-78 TaxID=2058332 RepID=UPI000C333EB8|nr:homoserine O-acetyltransferase [Paraglaciecola sp. MB-3u-78]PKG96697.1 homoserine acetyltransferase [Paraglaciecola sp. MB-3u-78]
MKHPILRHSRYVVGFVVLLLSAFASADLLVVKQRFETVNFKTFNGETIKQVAVGWESYGKLNAQKDNVILVTHYFSANSHAAGKYTKDDLQAGYWDALIGPGKAIDTNKFYVISVDSLANLGVHNPNVITTGPASINPDTGKEYGLDFPVVTIRDFVEVQKLVLESLGINKLHAVIGASMGSMQAIDWATAYPDWVPRMISVIGSGQSDAWATVLLERWAIPIRLDPNWRNGDYYTHTPPTEGLIAALMFITQDALTPKAFNQIGMTKEVNHHALQTEPLHSINGSYSIVNWLRERAETRAKLFDANHLLYLIRASQLFIAGHGENLAEGLKKIKAKSLFLPSSNDLLLMPYLSQEANQQLIDMGKDSHLEELSGDSGHLNGVIGISQKAQEIKEFIEK